MPGIHMSTVLLSRFEAARKLNVSLRLLDYLRSHGELFSLKIGRRVLIPTDEIERFVRQKRGAQMQKGSQVDTTSSKG